VGGESFEQIKKLAHRFEMASPIKGQVSAAFLLDEVFCWLRGTLELQRSGSLSDYIANGARMQSRSTRFGSCSPDLLGQDFALGDVEFRTVSKAMMDEWFGGSSPRGSRAQVQSMPSTGSAPRFKAALLRGSG